MTNAISSVRTQAPPSTPGAEASSADQPEVLAWEGTPKNWFSRNKHGLLSGLGVATAGGIGVMIGAESIAMRLATLSSSGRSGAWAGIGAAVLGAGLATGLVVQHFSRTSDIVPERPTGTPRTLPTPVPAPAVPGVSPPAGQTVAGADGIYIAVVHETEYYTDSNGDRQSRTRTSWEPRSFDWDLDVAQRVGKREGYESVDAAVDDLYSIGSGVALREQGGRFLAYQLSVDDNTFYYFGPNRTSSSRPGWEDVSRVFSYDPANELIIEPGGATHDAHGGGRTSYSGRVSLPGFGGRGDEFAEYAVRYRMNPDLEVGTPRTGVSGRATLAEALGEAQAEAGDQLVLERGGRFHVANIVGDGPRRTDVNDGLLEKGDDPVGDEIVAIEQDGRFWTPHDGWFVAPGSE